MPNLRFLKTDALYIHIPFCISKCPYCDFYSVKYTKKRVDQYWAALFMELEELSHKIDNKFLETIYFGGGTPSLINSDFIFEFLKKVNKEFKVAPAAEITMEVNPLSIDEKKIIALKRAGINRLSVGIQSFNDKYLSFLGRNSSSEKNREVLSLINNYFDNYSVDLIFALPEQSVEEFADDLKTMLEFKPPHISLYNLEIHPDTDFYNKYNNNEFKLPPEEIDAEMYQLAAEKLKENNYQHYEISNFSLAGYRARHNYLYWLYKPYLALGPGAAGFDGNRRYQNSRNLKQYLEYYNPDLKEYNKDINYSQKYYQQKKQDELKNGIREIEILTKKEQIAEYTFLALRTTAGLFYHKFYHRFQLDFKSIYKNEIINLKKKKLLIEKNQRIYLSNKGKTLANEVFQQFLL